VNPERVRDLYGDIGSPQNLFADLTCSSHNARLKIGYERSGAKNCA